MFDFQDKSLLIKLLKLQMDSFLRFLMNNILIWNIRGMMGKSSIRRLKLLIRMHGFSLLVLFEPMADVKKIEILRSTLSFEFCVFNTSNKTWML